MRNKLKWLICICIIAYVLLIYTESAYADNSVNISIGSESGYVGDKLNIKVKATSSVKFASDINLSYDANVIQVESVKDSSGDEVEYSGGGGVIRMVSDSLSKDVEYTVVVKLLKVGSSKINMVNNSEFFDVEETLLTAKANTATVTVNAPATHSSDNKLASLEVSPGTLTPAFSPDVTSYTLDVKADCNKIVVSAKASHSKAKVSVYNTELKSEKTVTYITVTAENGAKRSYTITTNRPNVPTESVTQGPEKIVNIGNENYRINEDYTISQLPAGFEKVDIEFGAETVVAGKNSAGVVIMYLEHCVTGVGNYYIYDTVAGTFSLYVKIDQGMSGYIVLEITDSMEKPANAVKTQVEVGDKSVGMMLIQNSEMYVFYGINAQGTAGWYSYDPAEGTVQRYVGGAMIPGTATDENESAGEADSDKVVFTDNVWKDIAIGAIIVAVALLFVMLILVSKLNRTSMEQTGSNDATPVAADKDALLTEDGEKSDDEADEDEYDDDDIYEEYEDESGDDSYDYEELEFEGDEPEESDGDILLEVDEPTDAEPAEEASASQIEEIELIEDSEE